MNEILDGRDYEVYCCEYLKKQGFRNVQLTQASNDQGIDIIAYKNHRKYGFQCKYYQKPVGNSAVQEAFAGSAYYNCDKACVITNNTFTRSAIQLAEETGVILYDYVDNQKKKIFPLLFKCIFLIPTLASIYLFNLERTKDSYSTFRILSTLFFMIAYFLSLNYEKSMISSYLSFIIGFISLILFLQDPPFNGNYQSAFLISIGIFVLWIFIHIMIQQFYKRKEYKSLVEKEAKQILEEEIEQYGNQMAKEISEDYHMNVTLTSYEYIDHIIHYYFRSYSDISNDLPLVQFEYNQKQIGNYTFASISQKTFHVSIENSHIISSLEI